MLLSRVAESVYWAGRYLERVEASARLISTHTSLVCDLPRSARIGWTPLLAITGSDSAFRASENERSIDSTERTEERIVQFLVSDKSNPGSIVASIASARTNLRTARKIFPRLGWEVMNRLYLWTETSGHDGVRRATRSSWLAGVIGQCQELTGVLSGSMARDHAYAFMEIGRMIERADMTTRILDVQAGILVRQEHAEHGPFGDIVWTATLKALGAHQMFLRRGRGQTGEGVGADAVAFLLGDPKFPRSVERCMTALSHELLELPRNSAAMARCTALAESLHNTNLDTLAQLGLHEEMDIIQLGLAGIHETVADTYFRAALRLDPALATAS